MLNIGIIGAGHFGAVHARALSTISDARLVAACRNDADGLARFVTEHGGTPYTDWHALLDDKTVEAVVITTPHHLHRDIAIAALAANKHVLLEKPMAATRSDCNAIIEAAERSAGHLMIGHVTRYFPAMQEAAAILATGEIGRPIAGTSAFVKLWMEPNRQAWHLDPKAGGGMLMTAGIHALDRLVFLMGGGVSGVSAMMGTCFHQQLSDDVALMNLRFVDGRFGQVASIGFRDGAVISGLELVCESGTLLVDLERGLRVGKNGHWRDLAIPIEPDPMVEAVRRQWQAFIDAIRSGAPSPISGAYGRHLVAIIEAASVSDRERREISIERTSNGLDSSPA